MLLLYSCESKSTILAPTKCHVVLGVFSFNYVIIDRSCIIEKFKASVPNHSLYGALPQLYYKVFSTRLAKFSHDNDVCVNLHSKENETLPVMVKDYCIKQCIVSFCGRGWLDCNLNYGSIYVCMLSLMKSYKLTTGADCF